MINFYLPDFFYKYNINTTIVELLEEHPEYFKYENMKIAAFYGCFPNQIWNGGRTVKGQGAELENIINTINTINNYYKVPIRFTYTNCLINEEHLGDEQCNIITSLAENGKNEILVNSPVLEKYLRESYPDFKYISSATRCVRDIDKLNELINNEDYYLVLGGYRDNFNFEFLDKIQNKDKLEILINPYCKPDCQIRELHYKVLSQLQLNLPTEKDIHCPCETMHWYELEQSNHIIKSDDLQKYIDMGFSNFKIEGRNINVVDVVDSYVYYLIKPEYQNMVRNILLRNNFY